MIQEIHGDNTELDVIGRELQEYVPDGSLNDDNYDVIKSQVVTSHTTFRGFTKAQCRVAYLRFLREKVELYGSTYFRVTVKGPGDRKSTALFVGINRSALRFIEPDMSGIRDVVLLENIRSCDYAAKKLSFTLKDGSGVWQMTTPQGSEIQAIFEKYRQDLPDV